MRGIENKKARLSVYDSIKKSMKLFLNSKKVYDQLKETMSLEQIAQVVPNCIKCFDFRSLTKEESAKFVKYYNNWAIANGLTNEMYEN